MGGYRSWQERVIADRISQLVPNSEALQKALARKAEGGSSSADDSHHNKKEHAEEEAVGPRLLLFLQPQSHLSFQNALGAPAHFNAETRSSACPFQPENCCKPSERLGSHPVKIEVARRRNGVLETWM